MSIVDISFIVIAVLGLFFGIFGKFRNKLIDLLLTVAGLAGAYFAFDTVLEKISSIDIEGEKLADVFNNKVSEVVSGIGIDGSTLEPITKGLFNVVVFWALAIGCLLVAMILGWIVKGIVRAIRGKKGLPAILSFGVFGAVNFTLVIVTLILPLLVLTPLLKDTSALETLLNSTTTESTEPESTAVPFAEGEEEGSSSIDLSPVMDVLNGISEQISSSKVLGFVEEKINEKNEDGTKKLKIKFLDFEIKDEEGNVKEYNIYTALGEISKSLKGAAQLLDLMSTDGDIMDKITEMSDDELREMIENLGSSEVVVGMVADVTKEMGIDIDLSDVDFSQEADTFIAVKNVMAAESPEDINIDEVADALANSELVLAIAETQEGALADLDTETKADIQNALDSKVTEGSLSAEDYETLMKLFGKTESK